MNRPGSRILRRLGTQPRTARARHLATPRAISCPNAFRESNWSGAWGAPCSHCGAAHEIDAT